jgi:hypothetical protein
VVGAIHQMRLGEMIEAVQGEPERRLDGLTIGADVRPNWRDRGTL